MCEVVCEGQSGADTDVPVAVSGCVCMCTDMCPCSANIHIHAVRLREVDMVGHCKLLVYATQARTQACVRVGVSMCGVLCSMVEAELTGDLYALRSLLPYQVHCCHGGCLVRSAGQTDRHITRGAFQWQSWG